MSQANKRTIYLSRRERLIGGRHFLKAAGYNGLGITMLGDTPVTLLALQFGANNLQLGLIASMLHVTGIVLLVVPRIFRDRNVVKIAASTWFLRGFVCLAYGGVLFLQDKAAVALLLVSYTLFCTIRTVGVSMINTLQKRLTVSRTQGELVFRLSASFQGSSLLSRLASYLVLSIRRITELTGILGLVVMGVVANAAAAWSFSRIPNRTRVEWKKGENLFVILRRSFRDPKSRPVLLARWIGLGQSILLGMAVPFLRRSVGLGANQVFLYTMSMGLAGFLASILLKQMVARAGSRPLLFFSSIPLTLVLGAWAFLSENLHLEVFAIMGFAAWFLLTAGNLAVARLMVRITPEDHAVGFNSMETFVTSLVALVLGFLAGSLADLSATIPQGIPLNDFALVFLLAALGSVMTMILAVRMSESGSLPLKETARVLTHLGNLRTWRAINTLESSADPDKRQTVISFLGRNTAPAASAEIRKILAEPLSHEKGRILESLFHVPRPSLAKEIRANAADPAEYHRHRAIFALGSYPDKETATLLTQLLDDPDPLVRSGAAKGLGRIGVHDNLHRVKIMAAQSSSLSEYLDYMIAQFHMDPQRLYLDDVFSGMASAKGSRWEQAMFTLTARQFGMSPSLAELYRDEALWPEQGLGRLLEEGRETPFILHEGENLNSLWHDKAHGKLIRVCQSALNDAVPQELLPLKRAIVGYPEDQATADSAMAVLYFTYQLLTAQEEE